MTDNVKVRLYLQHALLQLSAESYLHALPVNPVDRDAELIRRFKYGFNDPTHPFIHGNPVFVGNGEERLLPGYNRMVDQQARVSVAVYALIDHHANDQTGFSATLLRKNGSIDEYVLAFRSTEFRKASAAGDQERD